ncbi:ABC transporter substrate-binding protein, partial [Pseudorhodoplanes sp.]|uniref:ABC transporter substrate-binding protein n=1 Tax=Pseudorhodoplanes sp. TaxID=1934341 RepID=UPI003D0B584E
TRKLDFARATGERGIALALAVNGLARKDVEIVDIDNPDNPSFTPVQTPAELWAHARKSRGWARAEIRALEEGRVDAIYINDGRSPSLVETGRFKVIEDLALYPDWTLQVANGPITMAVNTDFAKRHPEVVVGFLRASIRAGRWINANPDAAIPILLRVTSYTCARQIRRQIEIGDFDFVPNLSPRNLEATKIQKDFLLAHGYQKNDFDVDQWADHQYLEQALCSLS